MTAGTDEHKETSLLWLSIISLCTLTVLHHPRSTTPCRTSLLSMSEIQNVAIVSHEVKKDEAKPFVTYNVKGLCWATS